LYLKRGVNNLAIESKTPEKKNQQQNNEFQSGAVVADLKVVRKVEGTKLEGKDGVKLGMFQLYRKGEDNFLPVEFKAIPLLFVPYSIVWDLSGKFVPGQPPALISIYDENRSIRWNPDTKEYEQGPLVYGDEDQGIPPCEPFQEYGAPGLLVYLLLEDERIGRIHLRFKEQEEFESLMKTVEPFSPLLVKSKKSKNKNGQTRYGVEFSPTKGFPEVDVTTYVSKAKEEVQAQVDLQEGVSKES
jgi:hypothetical protein